MKKSIELLLKPTPEQVKILNNCISEYSNAISRHFKDYIEKYPPKTQATSKIPLLSSKDIDASLPSYCKTSIALDIRVYAKQYYKLYNTSGNDTYTLDCGEYCTWRNIGFSRVGISENSIKLGLLNRKQICIMTQNMPDSIKEDNISTVTIRHSNAKWLATITYNTEENKIVNGFDIYPTADQTRLLDMMIDNYCQLYNKLLDIAKNDYSEYSFGYWNDFDYRTGKHAKYYKDPGIPMSCYYPLSIQIRGQLRDNYNDKSEITTISNECRWKFNDISIKNGLLNIPVYNNKKKNYIELNNNASQKEIDDIEGKNFSFLKITKNDNRYTVQYLNLTGKTKKNTNVVFFQPFTFGINDIKERASRINTYMTRYITEMCENPKFVTKTLEVHDYTAIDESTADRIESVLKKLEIPYTRHGDDFSGNLSAADFEKIAKYY